MPRSSRIELSVDVIEHHARVQSPLSAGAAPRCGAKRRVPRVGLVARVTHLIPSRSAPRFRKAAGGRVAGVVDTVGNTGTLSEGFRALGRAGTLVVLGHVPGAQLPVDPERLLLDELIVAGTRYATRTEIMQTMELVRLGRVTPVVGATFPLEKLNEALVAARGEATFGRIIIEVDPAVRGADATGSLVGSGG